MLRSYTAADMLTIGNAACGTIAIFLCLDYLATGRGPHLWVAFLLLPLALVFDVLDGYVARFDPRTGRSSARTSTRWPTSSRSGWRPPSSATPSGSAAGGTCCASPTSSSAG